MEKYLAFDYGKKRIGLAVSAQKLALRLSLINNENLKPQIEKIISDNSVDKLIVGMPLKENGEDSEQSVYTKNFISFLKEHFTLPVIIMEESLTTKIAIDNLRKLGFNKSQILKEKDSESARIMLQEFLDNL